MHGCTNVGVSGGHGAYFSLPWYILHVPILYLSLCVYPKYECQEYKSKCYETSIR